MKARLGAAIVAAGAAYALVEPYRFRFRTLDVGVRSSVELDVLHLSDTHMGAHDPSLTSFLRGLPDRLDRLPDLVIGTGDFIEGDEGIDPFLDSVAGIEARLGRFYVFGSHDMFLSRFGGFSRYFSGRRTPPARRVDTARLEEGLRSKGWISLINRAHELELDGQRVLLAGVDDPYLDRHRVDHLSRGDHGLAIGVMHSPDLVSELALAGFDLALAGHTHGGQIRVPGIGALVTNCSLPTGLAMGLHEVGATQLHVSPGLGHGHFSPIRFNCRPEATLLRLRPNTVRSTLSA